MSKDNIPAQSTDIATPETTKKRKLEDEESEHNKKQTKEELSKDIIPKEEKSEESKEELLHVPKELIISLDDISLSQPAKISIKANKYIKTILHHWETTSTTSKDPTSSALLLDTKKSLFPMLVQLRKTTLDVSQLTSLLTILYHLQRAQYQKALESYMKLSIGNVAWPIGVVSVSIHARSRDSKLFGGKANIMIDEVTRRWITALKRLITYSENNLQ